MIRIAIIDPQVVFRQLLRLHLETAGGDFSVGGESSLGGDATRLCEGGETKMLLLDAGVTDLPCAEVVTRLRREAPAVRLLLTGASYTPATREAVTAGAHGCVLKSGPLEDFHLAMKVVAVGGSFYSPRLPSSTLVKQTKLTPRQHETLELIASGLSTKQVAERLKISFKTADHHRTRLMKKLQVHDLASLVRFAIRLGVTEA